MVHVYVYDVFFFRFQAIVKQGDQNASGDLDFAEFVHYMMAHEKRLKLVFSTMDRNHDGEFSAFKHLV